MAEATAAERIAALRAKVASEREKTRAQRAAVSESSATTTTTKTRDETEEMDFEQRLAAFREEAEARLRVAVAEATEREQAKTAAIVAAMSEGSEGKGNAIQEYDDALARLKLEASEAERRRGVDAARSATAMDEARGEIEALTTERDKMAAELKKLRAHLLALEDEEDEVAEEQEREIDEAREEERREYERKLEELKKSMSGSTDEVQKLLETIRLRDEEVDNLQKALGAYYADMESADTQRTEAQQLRQKLANLTSQGAADRAAATEAREKAKEAEERLAKFEVQLKMAKEECIKATSEASKLRKALHHALQKSSDMMIESEKLLDKRIVSDLFLAYLERDKAEDVLDLLAKMLGFSDKQKTRMEALKRQKKRGVLGKIARAPVTIAAGAIGVALEVAGATGENKEVPVADLWISFLEKNAAEDNNDENKEPIPSSTELISAASEL